MLVVNAVSPDHIHSGTAASFHFHDHHTPLLEHCASKMCSIHGADGNDARAASTGQMEMMHVQLSVADK